MKRKPVSKIEPTKAERAFNTLGIASAAMSHALTLQREYSEAEARDALTLLKHSNPKLLVWFERLLSEVNNA